MQQIERLVDLQEIDQAIVALHDDVTNSKEAERLRRCELADRECAKKRANLAAKIQSVRRSMRAQEDELAGVEGDIESLQTKLFAGAAQSPKELVGLDERLQAAKHRKGELEEGILAALERVEELEKNLATLDRTATTITERLEGARAALDEAERQWSAERARLEQERASRRSAIDSEWLAKYDALYARFAGRPVAKVESRTCTGCHVSLPTSAKSAHDSQCPQCGRLLIWT